MNINVNAPHYGAFLMSPGPMQSPYKPMEGVVGDPEAPVKMGCEDVEIRLCEVQHHMKRVYSRALQHTLDMSHFFTASGVPLCRADLLGVLSPDEVLYIEQNLGHVIQQFCKGATAKAGRVDGRHQHVLHTCQALHGVMQEVHQTMQIISRSMMPDNSSAERHLRDLVHRLLDTLERGLEPYTATPFLLFVALSQGKLGQAVVALMHHRSLRELAERAPLVHELLRLLRVLCHVTDLRPILTQPTRFSNEQLSAWQVLQEAAHDAELFQQMDAEAQRMGASSSGLLGHHNVRQVARQLAMSVLEAHADIKCVVQAGQPESQPTSPPAAPQLQPVSHPVDDGDTPMLSPHLAAAAAEAAAASAAAAMSPAHARVMMPLRPASADPVPAPNAAGPHLGAPKFGGNGPLGAPEEPSPARPCSTEPSMCSGGGSGAGTSADGSCRAASPQHRGGKRPASTELDELNKDMGVANRFSPSALNCAPGAADSGRFGAGALLSPASAEQQENGGAAVGAWRLDSPVGGVAPSVQQARERQQLAQQQQAMQMQQSQQQGQGQQQGMQMDGQQQAVQQQGQQQQGQADQGRPQQGQDQVQQDQGQPQQLARSLSAMLHVSPPPPMLVQQPTPLASPHSHPATPNPNTRPVTTPPTGTPNRPGLDLFAAGGYMQLPPPGHMDPSLFEARSCSPSSSNDSKASMWGTPSNTSKHPSSPEYSTWGSPSPGAGPADGSPGSGALPLPLAALSSRLAAMQAAGGYNERGSPRSPLRRMQGPGSGTGSGPGSPFGDPTAAFAAALQQQQQQQQQQQAPPGVWGASVAPGAPGGPAADPAASGGTSANPSATVEVSYYDQAGTTVSLLDPGYLRPDSPMRLEFPQGLVGSLASSGSVRSSIDALGTAVPAGLRRIRTERVNSGPLDPRVAGIQGRGSHLGTDSPGITTALAAAQLAAVVGATGNADNLANGSGSQPGTPGSGRDTAPQLDRRRHSRPAQASTLSRPPRRNPPEPNQDNDVAPGHVHVPAAVAAPAGAVALGRARSGLGRMGAAAALSAARASVAAAQDDQAMDDDDTQPPPSPAAFVPAAFVPAILQQQPGADSGSVRTSSGNDVLTSASLPASPFSSMGGAAAAPTQPIPMSRPSWPLQAHCPPAPSAEPFDTWGSPRSDDSMLGSPRGFNGAAFLAQNPPRSPNRSPMRNSHSGLFPGAALAALRRSWDSTGSGSIPGSPIGNALLGGGGGFGTALPSAPPLERMGSSSSIGGVALLQESDQDTSGFGARALRASAVPVAGARHRLATAAAAEQPDEVLVDEDGWQLGYGQGLEQGSGYGPVYGVNQSLDQGGLAALLAAADQGSGGGEMEFEFGGDDVQDQALHQTQHDLVDLVGERTPLALLITRYEASSPVLAAKLLSLQDEFPTTRRVAGDGNCFYRAFVFALLEAILERPDPALHARLAARVQGVWGAMCAHMAPDADAAAGYALLLEFLGRVWYIAEGSGAAGAAAGGSSSGAAAGQSQQGSAGASTSQQPPLQQGQQEKVMPMYVGDLEAGLRRREVFDPIIKFARLASSWELRSRPECYEPFLAGCGAQYSGLDLAGVCERYVERMGEEVEQLQVVALAHALDVTVGILDVAGTEFGYIQHPEGDSPPLFWLVHCPGHYEIVYSREGMDPAVLLQMGA